MGILYFILVLVVIGVVLWLINNYVPMDPNLKQLMNVLVIILVVVWFVYMLLGGGLFVGPGPRFFP
jgi:bacteriorhodopsin